MTQEPLDKKCFVICPIGEPGSPERAWSEDIFNGLIAPIASEFGFSARRAIDDSRPGEITANLVADIIEADLVIADLTFHNANVFYELAIRHAQAKPYIHIAKSGTKIPFDVSIVNTIMVDVGTFGLMDTGRQALRSHFESVVAGSASFENPLKRYQQKLQADETGDPILQRLIAVEEKISQLGQPNMSSSPMLAGNPSKYTAFNRNMVISQNESIVRFLTNNVFRMTHNPANNKSKIITFASGGSIVQGRNDNEYSWRVRDGRLEILQSDGQVHSRFVYVPSHDLLQHTNDPDTPSILNQRIEVDR
jgi:hypothetical protein